MPGGERSASGFIATCWAPIGQSGARQRQRSERRVDDAVPEPAVDQVAVDEDDRFALARLAVADRPCGKLDFLALRRSPCASLSPLFGLGIVTYILHECNPEPIDRRTQAERTEATREALIAAARAALHRARLRGGRHRGDRPRRRGHPRRALPPLRRQGEPARGGLRPDRGGIDRAGRPRRPRLRAAQPAGRR